jgi:hypothetical protein
MPLVEAVSLITTLATAYQVFRGNKAPGGVAADTIEPRAANFALAYDFIRSAADSSLHRLDSVRSRLQGLITLSGLSIIGAPAIIRFSNDDPDLDSVLFLVALAAFASIAVIATFTRGLAPPWQLVPLDVYQRDVDEPDLQVLDGILRHAHETLENNERLIDFGNLALKLLSLVLMAQMILLVTWISLDH